MPVVLINFCVVAVLLRLAMLVVSIRHEKALKAAGGVELGAGNTKLLALTHVAFYIAAITEGSLRPAELSATYWIGVAIYLFGMLMLFLVVLMLGRFWTVKLILARDHELIDNPLFRWVRHPNYFLNILPELVGFALMLQAWWTLGIGLALYAIPLTIRIRQEEAAMSGRFNNY